MAKVEGTFTSTGSSNVLHVDKEYEIAINGLGSNVVKPKWSYDKGVTYYYGKAFPEDDVYRGESARPGAQLIIECTSYSSGTVSYCAGQGPTKND
ncbi:hypothetical protein [Sneathiella glossodoripedis]|uniref:hypothetical protein n=1 Tax=Sneathiella glossodoripedis TaxID=418853 RepID=UPI000470F403|nr:hypothetical protein [Sneathiella glossodoripedis]